MYSSLQKTRALRECTHYRGDSEHCHDSGVTFDTALDALCKAVRAYQTFLRDQCTPGWDTAHDVLKSVNCLNKLHHFAVLRKWRELPTNAQKAVFQAVYHKEQVCPSEHSCFQGMRNSGIIDENGNAMKDLMNAVDVLDIRI